MRLSRGRPVVMIAAMMAAFVAALVVIVGARGGEGNDRRDPDVVLSEEAGTYVSVRQLMIRGAVDQVRAAVRRYDGQLLESYGDRHKVLFPLERLTELRRLKEALEARGFEADYVPVAQLFP